MKEIFYDWGGANVWLFHAINDIRFEWLDKFMLLGTALADHTMFPLYLSLLVLFVLISATMPNKDYSQHHTQVVKLIAVTAVFSFAYLLDGWLLGILKPLLDFPRPPLALPPGAVNVIGTPEFHHSLPSGHSSFAMVVAASLWPILNRYWRIVAVLFVLWVGVSRMSLGFHFPADVIAGFLSSLAVVLLVYISIQQLIKFTVSYHWKP
jgi:membrane-associated phospholipid phosphatase